MKVYTVNSFSYFKLRNEKKENDLFPISHFPSSKFVGKPNGKLPISVFHFTKYK